MTYVTQEISGQELGKNIKLYTRGIKAYATRGASLDVVGQELALQCLIQMDKHNNFDSAGKLLIAMGPRSERARKLKMFFEAHSPIMVKYDKKTIVGAKRDKKSSVKVNVAAAEQVKFWEYQPPKVEQLITLQLVEKRISKILEIAVDKLSKTDLVKLVAYMSNAIETDTNVGRQGVVNDAVEDTPIKEAG